MSTHTPTSSDGSDPHVSAPSSSNSSRNRSFILLGVLILLLGALWYDYKVARPQVETAYEMIGKINSEYNLTPGKKYLTDKEVQQTLNRQPASIIEEGPYYVEVYSYRSGLPIKSHNYYAVYSAGQPLIFLKHYAFDLPMDELKSAPPGAVGEEGTLSAADTEARNKSMETSRQAAKEFNEKQKAADAAGTPGVLSPATPGVDPVEVTAESKGTDSPTPAAAKTEEAPAKTEAAAKTEEAPAKTEEAAAK